MSIPDVSLAEWFCLAGERENFTIDPARDRDLLFGDNDVKDEIRQFLRRSLVLKKPVRRVWIGQYGIGKTHRIFYTRHVVESEDMDYRPVYVVCSDIDDKSSFATLHYHLVNELGFEETHKLVRDYVLKLERNEPGLPELGEICQVADVAKAIKKFGEDTGDLAADLWRYLAGLKIERGAAHYAKIGKDQLDVSIEYAAVLGALAEIIRLQTNKTPLYLIDQMEALTKLTNRTVIGRWVETFRAILDLKNVSILGAVGAEGEDLDYLPVVLLAPELVRRFGLDNYVVMEHFRTPETLRFLSDLLAVWIDRDQLADVAQEEGWTERPDYDPDVYPFTRPAFEVLSEYLSADARKAKPSEILLLLDNVTAEAFLASERLIDEAFLAANDIEA